MERIELAGPFEAGTTGAMVPAGRPPISFAITEVQPRRGFTGETEIPGVLRFRHSLETTGGLTTVTHRVEIDGPAEMARSSAWWSPRTRPTPCAPWFAWRKRMQQRGGYDLHTRAPMAGAGAQPRIPALAGVARLATGHVDGARPP